MNCIRLFPRNASTIYRLTPNENDEEVDEEEFSISHCVCRCQKSKAPSDEWFSAIITIMERIRFGQCACFPEKCSKIWMLLHFWRKRCFGACGVLFFLIFYLSSSSVQMHTGALRSSESEYGWLVRMAMCIFNFMNEMTSFDWIPCNILRLLHPHQQYILNISSVCNRVRRNAGKIHILSHV